MRLAPLIALGFQADYTSQPASCQLFSPPSLFLHKFLVACYYNFLVLLTYIIQPFNSRFKIQCHCSVESVGCSLSAARRRSAPCRRARREPPIPRYVFLTKRSIRNMVGARGNIPQSSSVANTLPTAAPYVVAPDGTAIMLTPSWTRTRRDRAQVDSAPTRP